MSSLKKQVKQAMARATSAGRDAQRFGARVADRASRSLETASGTIGAGYRTTRKHARRLRRGVLASIEERPARALALALGAGLVAGLVLARRRTR